MSLAPVPTPSSKYRLFSGVACPLALVLLAGTLSLFPFFASAQPSPPRPTATGPTATPGPTPMPTIAPPALEAARPALPTTPTDANATPPTKPTSTATSQTSTPRPSPMVSPTPTKMSVRPKVAVDASLRSQFEEETVGEHLVNASGQGQRLAQSNVVGAKSTLGFVVRFLNTGDSAATFQVSAPASGQGWLIRYFDVTQSEKARNHRTGRGKALQEVEVTESVSGAAGWTTPLLAAGEMGALRLEVRRDADHPGQAFRSLPVRVNAVEDTKTCDVVLAEVATQQVAGIEYSLDQGTHWNVAPLLEGTARMKEATTSALVSTAGIAASQGDIIGLRAIPLFPAFPWPKEPDLKPLWHDAGYWNMGATIWVEAKVTQEMISLECGNTLHTRLFVKPAPAKKTIPGSENESPPAKTKPSPPAKKFDLDLSVTRLSIHVGGGSAGQTTLVATVKDAQGHALPGLRVRFRTYYVQDTPKGHPLPSKMVAGTLGGEGMEHDLATTDKEGIARIVLTSGERESAVIFEAELVLDGKESQELLRFVPQMMNFIDDHPQPAIIDDF